MPGPFQSSSLLLVVSSLLLLAAPARAEEVPPKISQKALDRMAFGLDANVQPGFRVFLQNDDDLSGLSTTFDIGASLRYGVWGFGLELGWGGVDLGRSWEYDYELEEGTGIDVSGKTAVTKFLLRYSPPQGWWWEVGLGPASINSTSDSSSVAYFVLGAKLGYQFSPIRELPNLSFGAFAGMEFWGPTQTCTPRFGCGSTSLESNLVLQAGAVARFVLPLTVKPLPPAQVYLLASASTEAVTDDADDAEVTATPTYEEVLPKLRRVALSAPDYCASRTAADATGQGTQTGRLMQTNCGVEMGEVERALTRAGYIVSSWTTLASMVQEQRMTPRDAAAKLGAEVLFQVNSLEHVQAVPQLAVNWKRRYFASNAYGDQLDEVFPSADEVAFLQRMLGAAHTTQGAVPGAMLDVNAILVETGQTIWFYRWQHLDTSQTQVSNDVLATRLENEVLWRPTTPLPRGPGARPSLGVAADSGFYQAAGGPANARDARSFRLMREVVADFVERFTQKPLQR